MRVGGCGKAEVGSGGKGHVWRGERGEVVGSRKVGKARGRPPQRPPGLDGTARVASRPTSAALGPMPFARRGCSRAAWFLCGRAAAQVQCRRHRFIRGCGQAPDRRTGAGCRYVAMGRLEENFVLSGARCMAY